jgi:hypothetical protein
MQAPEAQPLHRDMWQRFAAAQARAAPAAVEAGKEARIAARTAMPPVEDTPPYVHGSSLHPHQIEVSKRWWRWFAQQRQCDGRGRLKCLVAMNLWRELLPARCPTPLGASFPLLPPPLPSYP